MRTSALGDTLLGNTSVGDPLLGSLDNERDASEAGTEGDLSARAGDIFSTLAVGIWRRFGRAGVSQ